MTPTGSDFVLVDSNIWIDFLTLPSSPGGSELADLVRRRIAATTAIVSVEILYGSASEQAYERLAALMSQVHFLNTTQAVWDTVAKLSFGLKRSGEMLSLPDLIISAVALEYGCPLFTRDRAFERVSGLNLYAPSR